MAYRIYRALIAPLSVFALILVPNETFAASGTAHGGGSASTRSTPHASFGRSLRHRRGNNFGVFWPGDYSDGPSYGEPLVDTTQPRSGDVHYTYTNDVPWDAVHRYPPAVTPSEPVIRPYVPGCPAQTVTVPGNDGKDQTVNIVRCY